MPPKKPELTREVTEADKQADQREVTLEEECLKILALHQPVAIDLRRIAAMLKVNHDLERIGDLAVNIVQRADCPHQRPDFCMPARLERTARLATSVVRGVGYRFRAPNSSGETASESEVP